MREELRLALVMNGGVSLAVWIGGATAEIWRLCTRNDAYQHPLYQGLQALTETSARVDVISGTSAGGINGAALALALLNDTDFMALRQVWTEVGDFQTLLRNPLDARNPGSILKGDEYFLPEILAAFKTLATPATGQSAPVHPAQVLPLDLKLTATLLSGAQGRNVDDLGADLHDVDYRAYFHFRHSESYTDFDKTDVVQKLARAARSTASFPFAFEPSRVGPTKESCLRTYQHDDMKQTRHVVDGGILDNKPFRGARDAIFDMPVHDSRVRRVMTYLNPDPGNGAPFDFEKVPQPPTPAMSSVVAAAVMGIPTSQTIADQLLEIRRHNDAVRARRSSVRTLADSLAEQPARLLDLAEQMYGSYHERRLSTTFEQFVFAPLTLAASREPRYAQVMERFGRNTRDAMRRQFIRGEGEGWLPGSFERRNPVGSPGQWQWGMFPVEFAINVAMNFLRLVQTVHDRVLRGGNGVAAACSDLYACIQTVHAQRTAETDQWRAIVRSNLDRLAPEDKNTAPEDIDTLAWHRDLYEQLFAIARSAARTTVCEQLAHRVVDACQSGIAHSKVLYEAAAALAQGGKLRPEAEADIMAMQSLAQLLGAADAGVDKGVSGTLSVLLALEVVEFAFTDHQEMRSDTLIELVQISGNDQSPLGGLHVAAEKLLGVQVAHFGAFYKRSWRANDWTYGRLDASSRIVDILLNPARLCNCYDKSDDVFTRIRQLALARDRRGKGWAQLREQLLADWVEDGCEIAIRQELSFLDAGIEHLPDALPMCARALKRRMHYEIAMQEMGYIAAAVEVDQDQGALARGPGHAIMCRLHRIRALADVERGFVARTFACLDKPAPVVSSPQAARELVASGLLSGENFKDEVGSDLLTRTFAHTMATTQSTLAGKSAKLGPVATFFRALQLPVFGFYVAATALAKQSATAAAVIALLLGVGATLVTIHLATSNLPEVVATLGWAALCMGVLMACAASKRTALWIFAPLIVCMAAFALHFKDGSPWMWGAVAVVSMALLDRLQFPVALAVILGAGLYASTRKDEPNYTIAALTAVVVLALIVAYVHAITRRRRDWHAAMVQSLRSPISSFLPFGLGSGKSTVGAAQATPARAPAAAGVIAGPPDAQAPATVREQLAQSPQDIQTGRGMPWT